MNVRVLYSFSIKNIFYDKMAFLFSCDDLALYQTCMIKLS